MEFLDAFFAAVRGKSPEHRGWLSFVPQPAAQPQASQASTVVTMTLLLTSSTKSPWGGDVHR